MLKFKITMFLFAIKTIYHIFVESNQKQYII
nr:MAG TPA: hypothetical protein [Caudoviricetes sp.]